MRRWRLYLVTVAVVGAACSVSGAESTTTRPDRPTTIATTTSLAPPDAAEGGLTPPPRRGHALAATSSGLLLFGGWTVASGSRTYLGDTWLLNTQAREWAPAAPGGPPQRTQFALGYDTDRTTSVLFGGYVGDSFTYADTWLWDDATATWTRSQAPGPSGRAGAAMAYDAESQKLVFFGGAERPPVAELPLSETWTYDVAADRWVRRDGKGPVLRNEGHPVLFELAMVYDGESDRVILMIGSHDVWAYDENTDTWEARSIPEGLDADYMVAAAYHPGLDRVVTYGGAPTGRTQQTWLYDENTDRWERVATVHDPGPVGDHAMAYDAVTDRVYLFGGGVDVLALDGFGDVSAALWAFDGSDWTQLGE